MSLEDTFDRICEEELDGEVVEHHRDGRRECETDMLPPEGGMYLDEAVMTRADIPDEGPRTVTHQQEEQVWPAGDIYEGMPGEKEPTGEEAIFLYTNYDSFEETDHGGYTTSGLESLLEDEDVPIFVSNWETGNNVAYIGGADEIG